MTEQMLPDNGKSDGFLDKGWLLFTIGLTSWPLLIPGSQGAYEGAKRHCCFLFADNLLPVASVITFWAFLSAVVFRQVSPGVSNKLSKILLSMFVGCLSALVIYFLLSSAFRYRA
jgi:hypothetical protein